MLKQCFIGYLDDDEDDDAESDDDAGSDEDAGSDNHGSASGDNDEKNSGTVQG